MADLETPSPLRMVRIQVFQCVEKDKDAFFEGIIRTVKQKYEDVVKRDAVLEVSQGKTLCQFRAERLDNFFILTSTIKYDHDYELKNVMNNDLRFFDLSSSLLSSLSSNLLSTFVVFVPLTESEPMATALVEQYSDHLSRSKAGIGIVRGCLLSNFESGTGEEELFDRFYFLSPFHISGETAEKRVEEILGNIKHMVVFTAELSELYNGCKNFFSVLETGETEISEKTESFLWRLLGPEPVGLETLESWLGYIMERESTMSAMIANMRVNCSKAKSIASKLQHLFNRLSERSYEGYPTNSEIGIDSYNRIIEPFENYIVRGEALKSRLETVMEQVRTYLTLQQQKIAIEEQKVNLRLSSKIAWLTWILVVLTAILAVIPLIELFRGLPG